MREGLKLASLNTIKFEDYQRRFEEMKRLKKVLKDRTDEARNAWVRYHKIKAEVNILREQILGQIE